MKSSVQQFARELDRLCRNNIPMSQAFDMLENTAKSNMDLIVILSLIHISEPTRLV